MSHRMRVFIVLVLAMPLLVPVAVAQKPPAPAPQPPPSSPPNRPTNSPSPSSEPSQPVGELVMFLRGRVATDDGSPVPFDVLIQRVCNNTVRQQLYASSRGDFSIQLGSRTDSFLDASGESGLQSGMTGKDSDNGISRRELRYCELRASTSGFHDGVLSLAEIDTFDRNIDVGAIVLHRVAKIEGTTLSAAPYKAPKDARRAYEKGLDAERQGKLADARKYFQTAVEIYPRFADAWFQLGAVLEKEKQKDAARKAYTQAATVDNKFLPPYLSLASMAYEAENWAEVISFTGHILDLDPMNHAAITGYIVDLDPLNCADAYFYNAVANFKLNRFEDAEKSALKAEHIVMLTRFPQLHLLLADIFSRKNDYATAISEMQTYLELAPHARNAEQVRAELAKLEKLNGSVSTGEKPDRM